MSSELSEFLSSSGNEFQSRLSGQRDKKPDSQCSCLKSAARNSETVQVRWIVVEDGEEQHQRLWWGDRRSIE